jgi:VanZ family protein
MSSSPRPLQYWISAWWPVAAVIVLVACESTAAFGNDRTTHPLRLLWQAIFGAVSDQRWDMIHHLVRKSGHFIGYGAIGLAWLRAWRLTLSRARFRVHLLLALLGTALIASADEYHQSFLPNRGASPWDVLLDCCGAFALIGLAWIYMRAFRPRRLPGTE